MTISSKSHGQSVACSGCGSLFTAVPLERALGEKKASSHPGALPTAAAGSLRKEITGLLASVQEREALQPGPRAQKPLDEHEPETAAPREWSWVSPWGAAAAACAGLALLTSSLPVLHYLTMPLALAAAGLGGGGYFLLQADRKRRLLPLVSGVAGFLILAVALLWPALLGRGWWSGRHSAPALDPSRTYAVSRDRLQPAQPVAGGAGVDASHAGVRRGDVQVRVLGLKLARPEVKGSSKDPALRNPALVVGVRITNVGVARRLTYQSWGASPAELPPPTLLGPAGTAYPLRSFPPGLEIMGRTATASLAPGQFVEDVLIFDLPPRAQAPDNFTLELPGQAVGSSEAFRFQVVRSTLKPS